MERVTNLEVSYCALFMLRRHFDDREAWGFVDRGSVMGSAWQLFDQVRKELEAEAE